MDTTHGHMINS